MMEIVAEIEINEHAFCKNSNQFGKIFLTTRNGKDSDTENVTLTVTFGRFYRIT